LVYGFEQMQLAGMAFVFEVNWVVAAEAGVAKTLFLVEVRVHSFAAQIGKAVGFDKVPYVFSTVLEDAMSSDRVGVSMP
jgi:hypothetical protein